jgi:hypothetical protein
VVYRDEERKPAFLYMNRNVILAQVFRLSIGTHSYSTQLYASYLDTHVYKRYIHQTIILPNPIVPTYLCVAFNRPAADFFVVTCDGNGLFVPKKLMDGVVILLLVVIVPSGSEIENVKRELESAEPVATGTVKFFLVNELATVGEDLDVCIEVVPINAVGTGVTDVCATTATTRTTALMKTVKKVMIE